MIRQGELNVLDGEGDLRTCPMTQSLTYLALSLHLRYSVSGQSELQVIFPEDLWQVNGGYPQLL